tara:strand:- start:167 stop:1027 length:861 start_codon:yes stop_codon:yes gene_type:complete
MIKSMTGYGFSSKNNNNYSIEVETKSLNSKYFDLNLKSNFEIGKIENEIRNYVKRKLLRGKIEINIIVTQPINKTKVIDRNKYLSFFKEIKSIPSNDKIIDSEIHDKIFRNLSFVETNKKLNIPKKFVIPTLKKSINNCDNFRKDEGSSIQKDLKKNINLIKKELNKIFKNDKAKKKSLKKKIYKKINSIKEVQFDKNRIEQELFFYLEKIDINEEIVRLNNHIDLFQKTLNKNDQVGKKLNFICQEIGREINTIGSKCSEFKIQKSVITMKEHLEKIKEENFNVL